MWEKLWLRQCWANSMFKPFIEMVLPRKIIHGDWPEDDSMEVAGLSFDTPHFQTYPHHIEVGVHHGLKNSDGPPLLASFSIDRWRIYDACWSQTQVWFSPNAINLPLGYGFNPTPKKWCYWAWFKTLGFPECPKQICCWCSLDHVVFQYWSLVNHQFEHRRLLVW